MYRMAAAILANGRKIARSRGKVMGIAALNPSYRFIRVVGPALTHGYPAVPVFIEASNFSPNSASSSAARSLTAQ